MKKYSTAVLCITLLLAFSACDGLLSPDDLLEDTSGLTMDIQKITLSAGELATITGRDPDLSAAVYPPFATRNDLTWSSSDESVATVDGDGKIHIVPASVTDPESSLIKVWSASDPSIYAECLVTVYPNYPAKREWHFLTHPTGGTSGGAITGDIDMGDGMTLLQNTGGASGYNDGDKGPGQYTIDPDAPYEFGITPTGGSRGSVSWNSGANAGNAGFTAGHIRAGGNSRIMKIAALFGPFTITVNYRANGTNGDHADIRVGDTSGLRIEGKASQGSSSGHGEVVQYAYEGTDFVPLVYIETKGGAQIFDVIIEDEVKFSYTPVDSVSISGGATVPQGSSIQLTAVPAPVGASNPVYSWSVSGQGQLTAGGTTATATFSGTTAGGSFTATVTVTTTHPGTNVSTSKTAQQTVTVTVTAAAGGGKEWNFSDNIFTNSTTGLPASITSTTITIDGLSLTTDGSALTYQAGNASYGTYTFTNRINTGGGGSLTRRVMKFDVTGPGTVTVLAIPSADSSDRYIVFHDGTSATNATPFLDNKSVYERTFAYSGTGGTISVYTSASIYIYLIKWTPKS